MAGHHQGYVFPPPASMIPNCWPNQAEAQQNMGNFAPYPQIRAVGPGDDFRPRTLAGGGFHPHAKFNNLNQLQNVSRFNNWRPDLENFNMPVATRHRLPGQSIGCRKPYSKFVPQNNNAGCNGSENRRKHYSNHKPQSNVQGGKLENTNFFCEPCQKEFKCMKDKEAHLKGHVQCEVDGCTFTASRKTLKLHFIQNHEVGKFRICLSTDEDIQKWREERRKNYPSQSRALKKITEEKKNIESGSVLKTRDFCYTGKGSWRGRGRGKRHDRHSMSIDVKRELNNNTKHTTEADSESNPSQDASNRNDNAPEEPLSSLSNTMGSSHYVKQTTEEIPGSNEITHDSLESSSCITTEAPTSVNQGHALSILCSNYLTSDESNDDEDKKEINPDRSVVNGECPDYTKLDASIIEEEAILKPVVTPGLSASETSFNTDCHPDKNINGLQKEKSSKRRNKSRHVSMRHNKRKRKNQDSTDGNKDSGKRNLNKPTLLEMLLANDIRQERNKILQCIRTIVKKNFFMDS